MLYWDKIDLEKRCSSLLGKKSKKWQNETEHTNKMKDIKLMNRYWKSEKNMYD